MTIVQELFEKAVKGILTQAQYGADPRTFECMYFNPHTKARCIVGQLFEPADAEYLQNKYGNITASALLGHTHPNLSFRDGQLFDQLQSQHDCLAEEPFNRDTFLEAMRDFADSYDLNKDFVSE